MHQYLGQKCAILRDGSFILQHGCENHPEVVAALAAASQRGHEVKTPEFVIAEVLQQLRASPF